MDAYDAKYTRRGTERVIRKPEPQNPTEGFIDLLGLDAYATLTEQGYAGKAEAPYTFLKRFESGDATTVCGFVQAGPRRIYFVLNLWLTTHEIVSYGCDPIFATPPASRIDYSFEPHMEPDWSFQMRLEVTRRYDQVRATHEHEAELMNVQLHFGDSLKARVRWEAYAKKHGLKIVAKEIKL